MNARHAMARAAAAPSWGVRGAGPPLAERWGRGRTGRGGVPTNLRVGAPPAVLCPPARGYPRLSSTNNLRVWCKEVGEELGEKLLEEWDDPVLEPWEVTRASHHRASWKCRECGWEWNAKVQKRTRSDCPTGCPACAGRVPTETHNLALACEESEGRLAHLPGEWHHPTKRMEDFTPASMKKVPWRCGTCESKWDATIYDRTRSIRPTGRPTGCPACNPPGRPVGS